MQRTTILGLMAATLTTIAFLPQLFKVWQNKSAKDISLTWLITFSLGIFLWLLYGIAMQAIPIVFANGVTLCLTGVILYFKLKYR